MLKKEFLFTILDLKTILINIYTTINVILLVIIFVIVLVLVVVVQVFLNLMFYYVKLIKVQN